MTTYPYYQWTIKGVQQDNIKSVEVRLGDPRVGIIIYSQSFSEVGMHFIYGLMRAFLAFVSLLLLKMWIK